MVTERVNISRVMTSPAPADPASGNPPCGRVGT